MEEVDRAGAGAEHERLGQLAALGQRRGDRTHHRVAAALAGTGLELRGNQLPGLVSEQDEAGSPARVTSTLRAPRSRSRSAARVRRSGVSTGPSTKAASSQSFSLTRSRTGRGGRLDPGAGEVSDHRDAGGAGVGDQVAVGLEGHGVARVGVADRQQVAFESSGRSRRDEVVALVPRGRLDVRLRDRVPLAAAAVGDVATARARSGPGAARPGAAPAAARGRPSPRRSASRGRARRRSRPPSG